MERMWQERADYGHFFYRIPDGESAADAYDRVSGFNESLWRQFGDADFPSVCVLVTHGMMTRVFLMKWYHWSVEYFEDLRNVNHCEFIVMKQSDSNGKYILQNELRTWSDLKKRATVTGGSTPTSSRQSTLTTTANSSPTIPTRRWGGCANGCNHDKVNWPRRVMRKNTADFLGTQPVLPPSAVDGEVEDHPIASQEAEHAPTIKEPSPRLTRKPSTKMASIPVLPLTPLSPNDASDDASSSSDQGVPLSEQDKAATSVSRAHPNSAPRTAAMFRHLQPSGQSGEGFSDDSDYFPGMQHLHRHHHSHHHSSPAKPRARASSKGRQESKDRKAARKQTEKGWMEQSGMGTGARADTLGDGNESDDAVSVPQTSTSSTKNAENEKSTPILREAYKGDMIVENSEGERANDELDVLATEKNLDKKEIEKMKGADRSSLSEVY
jgi:hypothetical protein